MQHMTRHTHTHMQHLLRLTAHAYCAYDPFRMQECKPERERERERDKSRPKVCIDRHHL